MLLFVEDRIYKGLNKKKISERRRKKLIDKLCYLDDSHYKYGIIDKCNIEKEEIKRIVETVIEKNDKDDLMLYICNLNKSFSEETENKIMQKIMNHNLTNKEDLLNLVKIANSFRPTTVEILADNLLVKYRNYCSFDLGRECLKQSAFSRFHSSFIEVIYLPFLKDTLEFNSINSENKILIINRLKKLSKEDYNSVSEYIITKNPISSVLNEIDYHKLNKKLTIKFFKRLFDLFYENELYDYYKANLVDEKNTYYKILFIKYAMKKARLNLLNNLIVIVKESDLINFIFNYLSNYNRLHYKEDIDVLLLSKENRKKFISIVPIDKLPLFMEKYNNILSAEEKNLIIDRVSTSNSKQLIINISKKENLSKDNYDSLTKGIINEDAKSLYYFSKDNSFLSTDNKGDIVKALLEINDLEYICYYLINCYKNTLEKYRTLLFNRIMTSGNIKYIILIAVFYDQKLINEFFENKTSLYNYIIANDDFTEEEKEAINRKLFNKNSREIYKDKVIEKINKKYVLKEE